MSDAATANTPFLDEPPTAAGGFARLSESTGDRLNPILVKETRQALKSKQFTLWFVLLLIACWVATIGAIAFIGPSIFYVSAGGYLLYAYYVILALPLLVVVPFSAYRSLSSEHEENTRDLLEVSSLTPRQVINGKLGSAALQIGIYLSALAPCIAFTYLLRGVELRVIAVLLAYAVLASLGLSAVGLVVAAATRQKYAQVVMSVALAGVLFSAFAGLLNIAAELLRLSANDLRSDEFFWINLGVLTLYLTTLAIVYASATALTTFTSANRSTGLRVAVFVQQAAYVAWIVGLACVNDVTSELPSLFSIAASYWFVAGALLTGESPTLSLRVRRSLPQSWLGRAVGSWFSPGGGSGYVFATTNLMMLAGVSMWWFSSNNDVNGFRSVLLLTAYIVAYLGVGRLAILGIRRVAEVSLLGCFLIQCLFVLGGSALPYVVDTIADGWRMTSLPWLTISSPVWSVPRVNDGSISPDREVELLIAVVGIAVAVYLVNLALAGHEARQLRVATPRRVVEDELELHPEPAPKPTNPWGDGMKAEVGIGNVE